VGAATLTVVLGATIAVRGAARCPTAAEVADALAALAPAGEAQATGDWADVTPDGGSIRVRLHQADGTLLAEKRLPPAPCRQQAETAAVVLAAWAAQFHPELALAFETPPPAPGPPPAVAQRGPTTVSAAPAPRAPEPDPLVVAAGAGLLASLEGESLAPAAAIEARVYGRQTGWGGKLGLYASGAHRLSFGPGEAAWRRVDAALGVLRRRAWRPLSLEAGVDVVTGALFVEGSGFTEVQSSQSWDLGAEAGGRLGLAFGRAEAWLAIGLGWWLRPQLVEVAGIPGNERLPSIAGRLGVGVDVAWGR
jgi:hypothetical protein